MKIISAIAAALTLAACATTDPTPPPFVSITSDKAPIECRRLDDNKVRLPEKDLSNREMAQGYSELKATAKICAAWATRK